MDPIASRTGTARQICNHLSVLATACSRDVDEANVGDVDFRGISGTGSIVDVEVTLIKNDRSVGVLNVDVLVSNVVDVAISDICASPRLEASTVISVEQSYVLDPGIADVVLDTGILADRAHRDTVCSVAPKVSK